MDNTNTPSAWIDFNMRDEMGYWTIVPRGTVETGGKLHAYDGEGECALMLVTAVSDLPEHNEPFERLTNIIIHLDMLDWHNGIDPFYPGPERKSAS